MFNRYLEVTEARVESPIGDFISYSVHERVCDGLLPANAVFGISPKKYLESLGVDFYVYDQHFDMHYGSKEINS